MQKIREGENRDYEILPLLLLRLLLRCWVHLPLLVVVLQVLKNSVVLGDAVADVAGVGLPPPP